MLLGPTRITVFLTPFGRVVFPAFRHLAGLDRLILFSVVAVLRYRNDRRVDDLTAHGQIAVLFQMTVEVREQCLDQAGFRQCLAI